VSPLLDSLAQGGLVHLGQVVLLLLLTLLLPGLGPLLLRLPGLCCSSRRSVGRALHLAHSLNLEDNELVHEKSLEAADSNQAVETNETSVEVPGCQVNDLGLLRQLGQAEPKSENGEDDAGEPGQ